MSTELPELVVRDAEAWRVWLTKHHGDPSGVWLVLAKKGVTSPTALSYPQAVEEALCHGWIDGQAGKRDEVTYRQRFTPRRSRSPWSKRNIGIADRLIAEGRMHPAGRTGVERAKADGRWDAAYAGQATMQVPADLTDALAKEPRAKAMFEILTKQNRYAVVYRVEAAKRADTRVRRIDQFVAMLARGETLHPQKRTLVDATEVSAPPAGVEPAT
ncbi:MAG: YdeI/OmpD-associated family protein [Acidimicrobiales bacterium]|nr:YdeI/OmpD-associated family protein [Acidimicrobiales bacterium]